ncbi:MAG: hypothetical protein ACRCWO_13245 [Bosea sp. (in: a-proteobacteria)]
MIARNPIRKNTRTGAGFGLLIGLIGIAVSGCVSTAVVAQPGYYQTSPMYQDDFIYRQPQRRGHYQQLGYYQQPGYYQDQGYYDHGRRERGYYHQPQGRYAPQPQFYDREAAKDHWRAQKEAQKRAFKRGDYAQPQVFQAPGVGGGFGGGAGNPFRGGAGATAN